MTVLNHPDWHQYLPGRTPENPFKILALLNSRAVGDTIFYHVFCASVKRLFDHASLTIYQRDDRSYKFDLLEMNADKDQFIFAKPTYPSISIDSFQSTFDYPAIGAPVPDYVFTAPYWKKSGSDRPNLILSPDGMLENLLPCFEHSAFLKIPDRRFDALDAELVSHGLDPNRWFCVLNYREPGYTHRPPRPAKDLNPKPFMALVAHVIEKLGGQVVRVGHPNMTPFPKRPGFVDLAMIENNFMLHAHAIGRARFLVGSLSGINHLGSAMNTPTVIANCVDPPHFPGCWRDHDIALYVNLHDPNGRRVPIGEQFDKNIVGLKTLMGLAKNEGYRVSQNTAAELAQVVDALMESTMDCQSWREPSTPTESERKPNRFDFPMEPRIRTRILEFPDNMTRKINRELSPERKPYSMAFNQPITGRQKMQRASGWLVHCAPRFI
jgi:putative glycosyltransferase (TIGR04372 family)